MTQKHNLLLMSDAYKYSHFKQYPDNSSFVEVYIEARVEGEVSTFAGLQALCIDYLGGYAFTMEDIHEAECVTTSMGIPFNKAGWEKMFFRYNGKLPILIRAVPEGTRMKTDNVQMVVSNTDPDFWWLPGFLETVLLRGVWYPSTVATQSRAIKDIIMSALKESSDDPDGEIMFKLHDFGARGVSSHESAGLGGMSHLYNFYGTDTTEGVTKCLTTFGEMRHSDQLIGASIPAAEHSTITSWGKKNEEMAYRNILEQFPTGLVAIVADSYDIWNAIDNIFSKGLRKLIEEREGTLIIRPDSGDPVLTPIRVIERLMDQFGWTYNEKGYKVLPDYIRVLQGDGISIVEVEEICRRLLILDISVSNIAFGMGGCLLQQINRDILDYACKCSSIVVDGVWKEVFKQPITDSKKNSKRGSLRLVNTDKGIRTVNGLSLDKEEFTLWSESEDLMVKVLENGMYKSLSTLSAVRIRAGM